MHDHHRHLAVDRPGRALCLVDLENLAGGTAGSAAWFLAVADRFCAAARLRPHDLVVAAMDASVWSRVVFELPRGWRVRFGFGPDGADRALLDSVDIPLVAGRFARVVIGSGDRAFAHLAADLATAGCRVEVVSRPGSLSAQLAAAAGTVTALPDPTPVLAA